VDNDAVADEHVLAIVMPERVSAWRSKQQAFVAPIAASSSDPFEWHCSPLSL
jgi:hypothetical protein